MKKTDGIMTRCPLKEYNVFKGWDKIAHKQIDEKHAIVTLLQNGTHAESFILTPRNFWYGRQIDKRLLESYKFLLKHNSNLTPIMPEQTERGGEQK